VSKRPNIGSRMRPWIAVIAAYALGFQVLLTGLSVGHSIAAGNGYDSGPFVICHGDSSSEKQDLPGKEPLAGSPCVFCTLVKASCAIVPTGHGIAINDPLRFSNVAARTDDHILEFNSPTGQYQRGPPIGISIFG
jgi:hypothetical protein